MSLPTFTFSTTAHEVADALADTIHGKNVLITGTSLNGIGFEAARTIAKYANMVIITGYNLERLKLSEEAIKKDIPGTNIHPLVLDLTSLASVHKAAAEVIIHNAAHGGGPFQPTVDGFESQMSTAHIAPFLLTKLLTPKLLAANSPTYTPRVVMVSSEGHTFGNGVDLEAIAHPKPEKYSSSDGYFQAKSANVLFAIELSKRAEGKIKAYSLHPGNIFTNLMHKPDNKAFLIGLGALTPDGQPDHTKMAFKTMGQGAATTLVAAFDPRIEGEIPFIASMLALLIELPDQSGSYLCDCVVANDKAAAHSTDPKTAEKLWTVTEEALGEEFTF
ncbi:short-chain dehydrogenase/reductase family protein [Favolaschia claudopus]|uniref:Short-chain dehydrogenase/reductase family protein n=1 Tax=Favolaschia claudopus TaxID=2862362 RepID=A0AAW0DDF7_9AGAR